MLSVVQPFFFFFPNPILNYAKNKCSILQGERKLVHRSMLLVNRTVMLSFFYQLIKPLYIVGAPYTLVGTLCWCSYLVEVGSTSKKVPSKKVNFEPCYIL